MPRYARQQSASKIYHIMIRGNEKKAIFLDDEDNIRFIHTLERMRGQNNYTIYAFCLMYNHVHLLVREEEENIQRSMKRIGISYAHYFNKKYNRVGHLFQDRFRSEPVEQESYLLAASRYIHNNPVKAGIVQKAEEYKWSSYQEYIQTAFTNRPLITNKSLLLSLFSDNQERAVELLKKHTSEYYEDDFIDVDEKSETDKQVKAIDEILQNQIAIILKSHGLDFMSLRRCTNKSLRNEVLKEVKNNVDISTRELSRITGFSKDIISRA